MKKLNLPIRLILATTFISTAAVNAAQANDAASTASTTPLSITEKKEPVDVPRMHWGYSAIEALCTSPDLETLHPRYGRSMWEKNWLLTRYEMAVVVAKVLDERKNRSQPFITSPLTDPLYTSPTFVQPGEAEDLLAALMQEYRDEIRRIGVDIDVPQNHTYFIAPAAMPENR